MPQASFCSLVRQQGSQHYRSLPWRDTRDPYEILVSEVMLQQTQVARVQGRWQRFLAKFPTLDALASATNADVLNEWQGMGYNRRALSLKRCAEWCSQFSAGQLPHKYEELLSLPGIGPSTAAGVLAFAYDEPCLYIETNVRTVFLHHLFPYEDSVSDSRLRPLVEATCPSVGVRAWYYALLDYGSVLKKAAGNASARSAHYHKQSKFAGSHRQKRAALLRIVLADPNISSDEAFALLAEEEASCQRGQLSREEFEATLHELTNEGFFEPLV